MRDMQDMQDMQHMQDIPKYKIFFNTTPVGSSKIAKKCCRYRVKGGEVSLVNAHYTHVHT